MQTVPTTFDDLDDFDSLPPITAKTAVAPALVDCYACGGRGKKRIGYAHPRDVDCFTCHGTGQTKPGAQKRREAWKKGQATMARNKAMKAAAFATEHPDVIGWLNQNTGRGFEFADSLQRGLAEYGSLTEGQVRAVRTCMQRAAVRAEERASERVKAAPVVGAGGAALLAALTRALSDQSVGLKAGQNKTAPKIRTELATFSMAKPGSKNPGCVYVVSREGRTYLGKITPAGMFIKSWDCTAEQETAILGVLKDPLAAAVQYGRLSGTCSCCGRRLDNAVSIELGIGPICRSKMFGG